MNARPEFRRGDDVVGWQSLLAPLAAVLPAGDDVEGVGAEPSHLRLTLHDRNGTACWKVTHVELRHACPSGRS